MVALPIVAIAILTFAFLFALCIFGKKRLVPIRLMKEKVGGPYRLPGSTEGDGQEPEPLSAREPEALEEPLKVDGCLTAKGAELRFQKAEEAALKDMAKLFKEKIEPDIEEAIAECKRSAFCYPLTENEVEALSKYAEETLGYKIHSKHSDSFRIEF